MGIRDWLKSINNKKEVAESADNLNKSAATGDAKKVGAAVRKADKPTANIMRQTQAQSNKQSGKLNKQFDRVDAATNAWFGNENADPNADETDRFMKKMQQESFPDVPKSPVATNKAQQAPVQQARVKQAPPRQQAQQPLSDKDKENLIVAEAFDIAASEKTANIPYAPVHKVSKPAVTAQKQAQPQQPKAQPQAQQAPVKQAPARPKQQTQHQKTMQQHEARRAKLHAGHAAKMGKLKQAQERWEGVAANAGKVAQVRPENPKKPVAARPPPIKAITVPTSPVSTNKFQQADDELEAQLGNESLLDAIARTSPDEQRLDQELMDEFELDEPEPETAKQDIEKMLDNYQEDMEELFNDDNDNNDDWEQEMQAQLDAENKTRKLK